MATRKEESGKNRTQIQKTVVSMADYAAVVQFAKMRGAQLSELQIENLLVVHKSPQKAFSAFREMASDHDAVLNINRYETQVPVRMGDVMMMKTYTCVRGAAVSLRKP